MTAERREAGAVWVSGSTDETERLGAALAPALAEGDVIVLNGPLGAGKTRVVAGIARGLGCEAVVRSPSFTLVNEYHGRLLLAHVDLYRLETDELSALGLEDQLEDAVLAVEWGEKLPSRLRAEALEVTLEIRSADTRAITAVAGPAGGRGAELLAAWRAALGSRAEAR